MRYYDELEEITKLFSSPGENICEQPEFVPKLKRLDECLEYMQNNVCVVKSGEHACNGSMNVVISNRTIRDVI